MYLLENRKIVKGRVVKGVLWKCLVRILLYFSSIQFAEFPS